MAFPLIWYEIEQQRSQGSFQVPPQLVERSQQVVESNFDLCDFVVRQEELPVPREIQEIDRKALQHRTPARFVTL